MLHKHSEQVAKCLRQAAEADTRAKQTTDKNGRAAYQLIAATWRNLAFSYEFQESLQRFISFNESRTQTLSPVDTPVDPGQEEMDSSHDAEIILRSTPFLLSRCTSDLRYSFVSEALARMLGHKPEEIVGRKLAEVLGDEAFQTILPHVNAVLSGQYVEYEAEVPYHEIGPRIVHVNYAPDKDKFGQVSGWIASIVDITEQRRAERRIAADLQAMTLLGEVGSECVRDGASVEGCLYQVLDAAIVIAGAKKGNIQLPDPSSGVLRIAAQRGFKKPFLDFFENVDNGDPSACAAALESARRVIVEDVSTSEIFAGQASEKILVDENVRAVIATPLMSSKSHTLGMLSVHFPQPHSPKARELHLIDLLARQAADFLERTHISNDLRESGERLRRLASIVEFSDDAILSKNLDGAITSWNKGAERIFGYTAEEAIGQSITIIIPEDRRDEEQELVTRIRRGERIDHFETLRQPKQGGSIAVSLTISPVKNDNGQIVGASKIARDITERMRSGEQIAILAREAEHRSKNLLANVQAIVKLSQAETADGLKQAIEGRIRALANVHSLFAEARWMGAEISAIASEELAPYTDEKKRFGMEGPRVVLAPEAAQAIAVVLHELATNAAKYGALSAENGRVDLTWSQSNGELRLCWTESSGPAVSEPARRGFGRRIIERLTAQQNGTAEFEWRSTGLVCEITIDTPPG